VSLDEAQAVLAALVQLMTERKRRHGGALPGLLR
jgi:hypothetical protein